MEKPILIGETIDFLSKFSPEVLEDLRIRHPNKKLWQPLGDDSEEDIPLNLAVETTLEGMKIILIESQRHDKKMTANLTRARHFEITGDIISIISSSSLFLLIGTQWTNFTYVMNSLALIGVILPKVTQYFTTVLHPEGKNLSQLRNELIELQSEAEEIYDNLRLCKQAGYPEKCNGISSRDLVRNGNALSRKMRDVLRKIGVEVNSSANVSE